MNHKWRSIRNDFPTNTKTYCYVGYLNCDQNEIHRAQIVLADNKTVEGIIFYYVGNEPYYEDIESTKYTHWLPISTLPSVTIDNMKLYVQSHLNVKS